MDKGNKVLSCLCHYCFRFSVIQNGNSSHLIQVGCDHKYYQVYSSVQFSHSVMSNSLRPHEPQHQASLSITNSRSLPKLMSIESVMPSTISSSVVPFSSCPQSFPASRSFQMSQLFASGGQSIGVSASTSVLPMNTQD